MDEQKRKHHIEVDLPATPEQVWEAISEGDKVAQWFAPEVRITPGAGGKIFLSWGPGCEGETPIRIWEPNKRMAWVEGEGTPNEKVCEFEIIAKEGGTTTLRLVHSGFGASASFDNEYESTFGGWHTFFAMLRYGLTRFPGVKGTNVGIMKIAPDSQPAAWDRMQKALQITATTEGSDYSAVLGPFQLQGKIIRAPKAGYLALSVESVEDSLLGVFVEGGKQAMVTFEWVLFGDTQRKTAEVRQTIEEFLADFCKPQQAEEPAK
jgi:uncharacterized protein YndB with AHSA1/START domain